jgi:type II secretory pathway component GspD/PulD (secretin)
MDNQNEKGKMIRLFSNLLFVVLLSMAGYFTLSSVSAGTLKLVDMPLSQVLELYSKTTGKNVFLDESVQKNRKINVFLQGMDINKALGIIQKMTGLESCEVSTDTIMIFPPEKAQRYRSESKPWVLNTPEGLDSKWVSGLLNTVVPGVKSSLSPKDEKSIVLFGPESMINSAKDLADKLPALASKQMEAEMSETEARLAFKELKTDGVSVEVTPGSLIWSGSPIQAKNFNNRLRDWQNRIRWGKSIFTAENLEQQKVFKAAEASKCRAIITDLGGCGSLLIEGPENDRNRICEILRTIDKNAKLQHKSISLGEIKPETAKEAVRSGKLQVESIGDQRMILIGKEKAVNNAFDVIQKLGRKRQQVVISLKLAEISRSRLKKLGINLEKSTYTYSEMKKFHPEDLLPLLLNVMNEGKDGKILAEPNLRVLEGEEAKVVIGDRIPLEVAATAQTDSGSTLKLNTQLSWVDAGIKMTVKNVSVNPDNSIKMAIKCEVSSVVAQTKQGYPQIRTREAESVLRINNGGTVIMGGLFNQEKRTTNDRIPILSQIPFLGVFARSRDKEVANTEIIIVAMAKVADD